MLRIEIGLGRWLVVAAMVSLLARCVEGLSKNRYKMKPLKIGIFEVIYGTLTVLAVSVGHHAGI